MKLYFEQITGGLEDEFDIDVIDPKKKDITSNEFFWLVYEQLKDAGFQITNTIKKGVWDFQMQMFYVSRKEKRGGTYQIKLTKKVEFREDEEVRFLKRNEDLKKAAKRIVEMTTRELINQKTDMKEKLNKKENLTTEDIEESKVLRMIEDELIKRIKDVEDCLKRNKIEKKDGDALMFNIGIINGKRVI
jgi:hypothetical protein